MTQIAINYAKVLYELKISSEAIEEAEKSFVAVPKLKDSLASPVVSNKKKHNIIEKVFPKEIQNFLKVLCDYQSMEVIDEIFAAYKKYYNEQNDILAAKLIYVTAPDEAQLDNIKTLLIKKYNKKSIELSLEENPDIMGGFILETGNIEIDWSTRGRLNQLQQRLVRR